MAEAPSQAQTLLIFDVGTVAYAIDIHASREILRPVAVEALPTPQAFVVGAIEHRGEVLPVVDLRLRFGLDDVVTGRGTRQVVVQHEGRAFVLVVDRVRGVWEADLELRRELPQPLDRAFRGARAAYSVAGRLVFVLDVAMLATLQETPAAGLPGASEKAVPELR